MNYETYLKKGWSVFPVQRNKKPYFSWEEYQTRLPNSEEIAKWKKDYPNANLAVATGKISGCVVIDLDGPEGLKSGSTLSLASPLVVLTGRGKHLYYKYSENQPEVKNAVKLFPGLDIRGDGGYALLPPSLHENGKPYRWANGFFSEPPVFPIEKLKVTDVKAPENKTPDWVTQALESLSKGAPRHITLLKVAGYFHAKKIKDEIIYAMLLPYAEKCGIESEDLLNNIVKKYPTVEEPQPSIIVPEFGESLEDFLADEQKIDWLVPGIVARKALGFIAGLPETLKTWLAMDLAIECARGGGRWLNKFDCSEAKVLFIDQERFKGETQRRFKALIAGKDLTHKQLNGKLFIRCGTSTRLDLQYSFEAFKKELDRIRPDLVIVDSFVTFHNAEENDRFTIQKVIEKIKELRNEFGCTFLFLDHENKLAFDDAKTKEAPSYGRMTGSIAKPAAAELVLTVRKHNENSAFVYMTKSSLATPIESFMIQIRDVTPDKSKIVVEGVQ